MNDLLRPILSGMFVIVIQVNAMSQHAHTNTSLNGYADSVNAGLITKDSLKNSPIRVTMANIGNTHVHITYGSPGVRGRFIWGGLVAFNEIWATGAHNATTIDFSTDVFIQKQKINAGKYALFTIPGQKNWIIILNKKYQQHLADEYDVKEDVIRIKVIPETISKQVPRLTFRIEQGKEQSGSIILNWDFLQIKLPFETK